jgi:hypothetical protein
VTLDRDGGEVGDGFKDRQSRERPAARRAVSLALALLIVATIVLVWV